MYAFYGLHRRVHLPRRSKCRRQCTQAVHQGATEAAAVHQAHRGPSAVQCGKRIALLPLQRGKLGQTQGFTLRVRELPLAGDGLRQQGLCLRGSALFAQ
ncbi:hypothetical protein RM530_11075 [Algiphilus sp. W345]|uniref:Uncharacterized protein n=1 Tax=Banduia mediterranea TaxID=3075609 RepID=A0ABU2WJ59_9GAMM|nr:hypothetical protein [Algiphilus sp. W345]MDT0497900.1 hypothetical protein [Algiphilus sp. W345]